MSIQAHCTRLASLLLIGLLGACVAPKTYDYSAFKESRPASILVLPPVNQTPEIKATAGVLAQVSQPLAEAGYYVMPVAVVEETFRQNGITQAADMHAVAPAKLREIFGADAVLYLSVKEYGTTYAIVQSTTTVAAEAKLVDLKNGNLLWDGSARASSAENQNNGGGGIVGMLVAAAVNQIVSSLSDEGYRYAGIANTRLLSPRPAGLLYGPRSPHYQRDGAK